MSKEKPLYTLIIPTYNRPNFLLRCLRYYYTCQITARIIVADGSGSSDFDVNAQSIKSFQKCGMDIYHFKPSKSLKIGSINMGFFERLKQCLETVDTPYVNIIADDDFVGKDYLHWASSFLHKHDDYSSVFGAYCGIYLKDERESSSPYGEISHLDIKRSPAAISYRNASVRLTAFHPGYGGVFYTMHRTCTYKKSLQETHKLALLIKQKSISLSDEPAAELILDTLQGLLLNYMTIACGKVHSIQYLNMANHYHGSNWGQSIVKKISPEDSYFHPLWAPLMASFIESVANVVAQKDRIEFEVAKKTVSACLWRMVGGRLTHGSNEILNVFSENLIIKMDEPIWRARLRKIPILRNSIRTFRRLRSKVTSRSLRLNNVPELEQVVKSIECKFEPIINDDSEKNTQNREIVF